MLIAMLSWLNFAHLGIGPVLTTKLAIAAASNDRRSEASLFLSGLLPPLVVLLFVSSAAFLIACLTPPAVLFGHHLGVSDSVLKSSALTAIAVISTTCLLSLSDSLQLAYQRQHVTNLANAIGNGTAAVVLGLLYYLKCVSLPAFLLALNVPCLVARAISGVMLLRAHAYLFETFTAFETRLAKRLAVTGAGFLLSTAASALIYQYPIYLVVRTLPSAQSAPFVILMSLFTFALNTATLVGTPLWPSIADGKGSADWDWIAKKITTALTFTALAGVVISVSFFIAVPHALRILYPSSLRPSRQLIGLVAAYLSAAVLENVLYYLLLGLDCMRPAVFIFCVRSILAAAGATLLITRWAAEGVIVALLTTLAVTTLWMYPFVLTRQLRAASVRKQTAPSQGDCTLAEPAFVQAR